MSNVLNSIRAIRPRAVAAAVLAAAAGLAPLTALADPGGAASRVRVDAPASAKHISMGVGKSMILELPRDVSEIFVADPKVANVIVRSARKLYIIAAGGGSTSIYAMDAQGQTVARYELVIGRDIAELTSVLNAALPGNEVVPRTVNDTIILTGFVNDPLEAQKAIDIANGFIESGGVTSTATGGLATSTTSAGGKIINAIVIRGRDQVLLKVTVAEVKRTILKQLGVTGAIAKGGWGSISLPNAFPINGNLSSGAANIGALGVSALAAQIQAYETNGVARTLAEPTVTAISGEKATFTAGGQVPIATACAAVSSTGGCSPGIQYKNVGVTIEFTPVVLAEGRIRLKISTEVNEVDSSLSLNGNPGFKTRANATSVELPSGGTIVTAGLIETKSASAIQGLPGLMNLPILGALFRSRDFQRDETELLFMVTPYIAKPSSPAALTRPTDGFADPSDPQGVLLGRVNQIYSTTGNPQIVDKFKGRVGFIAD